MSSYVYANVESGSFKVWGFDAFESNDGSGQHELITYWGRIGVQMCHLQKRRKYYQSCADARNYVHAKIQEKLGKRYKGIPNGLYFRLMETTSGLAELLRIIDAMGDLHYYQPPEPITANV